MPTPTSPPDPASTTDGRRPRRVWLRRLFQAKVKDLVARRLQDDSREPSALMAEIVAILPSAWQHPEAACARIVLGEVEFRTANYRPVPWRQSAPFFTNDGARGLIEVSYLREFPEAAEGPFLAEERGLLNFLAEMFHGFIGRKLARQALLDARDELERRVRERTEELQALASQLSLTEERERRAIAADLHDHIGQTLALAKIKLGGLAQTEPGPARAELAALRELIEEAIQYTRSLTFELSSPLLYELGLTSAVEALAESLQARHGLAIEVQDDGSPKPLGDEAKVILFKAVRELLMNAVKHSRARRARVSLRRLGASAEVLVEDDGEGFAAEGAARPAGDHRGFGLLSIREGMRHCGGVFELEAGPGRGVRALLRSPLEEET